MNKYEITLNTWNKLAKKYEEVFMDMEDYNETYEAFTSFLKINASILEIGCGPGNATKRIRQLLPYAKILATDASENMVKAGARNVPSVLFKVLDARDVSTLNINFDGVFCGFCAPYLNQEDLVKLIADITNVLTASGVLYLSTIEGDHINSGFEKGSSGDEVFVYYYSTEFLEAKFLNFNLVIKHKWIIPYVRKNGKKENHLIYILKKNDP